MIQSDLHALFGVCRPMCDSSSRHCYLSSHDDDDDDMSDNNDVDMSDNMSDNDNNMDVKDGKMEYENCCRWSMEDLALVIDGSSGYMDYYEASENVLRSYISSSSSVSDDDKHRLVVMMIPGVEDVCNASYIRRVGDVDLLRKVVKGYGGRVTLVELAEEVFDLPYSFVRQMLDVPSGEEGSCKEEEWREFGLWFRHNRSEIVSSAYLQEQLEFIVEFVKRCIDVPTSVEDLFQQCNDAYCRDGNNSGSLEMDQVLRAFSSCDGLGELRSGNNIFFPFVFSLKQRREVDDLFRLNGYITKFQACVQYHLSEAAIESFVQKSFPRAVSLPSNTMIDIDAICIPLQGLFVEAIESHSYVDLNDHLAEALLSVDADVRCIVMNLVLPNCLKSSFSSSEADIEKTIKESVFLAPEGIWISYQLVNKFREDVFEKILKDFTLMTAQNLFEKERTSEHDSNISIDDEIEQGKVRGRKQRQRKRKNTKIGTKTSQHESILNINIQEITDEFVMIDKLIEGAELLLPFLSHDPKCIRNLCNSMTSNGILAVMEHAIQEHLFLLREEARKQFSAQDTVIRDRARFRVQCEQAFERPECFATLCIFVQLQIKFLRCIAISDCSGYYEDFEKVFLNSTAAMFSKRLTEYVLTQNDVNPGMCFDFSSQGMGSEEHEDLVKNLSQNGLPQCCQTFPLSLSCIPPVMLTCSQIDPNQCAIETNTGKSMMLDPLKALRTCLPANSGTCLARLWKLCGGSTYYGGHKDARGDSEKFLEHAEESCLIICGLPFKKIDKKKEKQFLFQRRRELVEQLQNSSDHYEVLRLTTLLLCQKVKGLVGVGHSKDIFSTYSDKLPEKVVSDISFFFDIVSTCNEGDENGSNEESLQKYAKKLKEYAVAKDLSAYA